MKEQLETLKNLLKEEAELEEARKPINKRLAEIKKIKEGLAEEITKQMKTDNYSNEFCTIMRNKKLAIEVKDEVQAMEFMKSRNNFIKLKFTFSDYWSQYEKMVKDETRESF